MNSTSFRCVGVLTIFSLLLATLSCGHDQQLVGITIQPGAQEFGAPDPALNVQLRALGQYIHPPATKDITNQVAWVSNTPNLVTVGSTGLLAPAGIYACGGALVSATVTTNHSGSSCYQSSKGALVTDSIVVTVDNLAVKGCPGFAGTPAQPTLTVDFGAGGGTGTVNSSPAGIGCSAACSGNFPNGTTVTLTATPTGLSTFGSWVGCDSIINVNQCVVNLTSNRTVTVTFN